MVKLTPLIGELLDKALADGAACLIGTASKDSRPQISPRGSVAVFDEQTLCYWERGNRSSRAQIEENPQVVVYYRNPARAAEIPFPGAGLRFHGRARVVDDGELRDRVWNRTIAAEQARDPDRKGVAVLIDVDFAEEFSGKKILAAD
jgi:general stress protein 26